MKTGHVRIGISNELPDENMARLVYPIRYRSKTLPANTAQHTYKGCLSVSVQCPV